MNPSGSVIDVTLEAPIPHERFGRLALSGALDRIKDRLARIRVAGQRVLGRDDRRWPLRGPGNG
jgi:hypothetical protein